ncbi:MULTISPECIES: hypothetical protein [unclassified Rathayibacter]|uniref:hypothetical protein n=1 Tax=unclassified Rathayibacter TaxID=2609250 RepID=UPI0006FFE422|nr:MULTISPECIES: hypothetical protein [unclassified Rathayibacter]KQQ03964.1 hypothetical protein ASF42_10975 [Rathayibacter sp. Leaf294]KQS12418.1 hypothetical protein ASG06_10975 [Rathayibacter sp. Leaf185]
MTELPLFFVRDLRARGASTVLADAAHLEAIWRGVRAPAAAWEQADERTRQHARARAAVGLRHGVLVGESAALLHGIPLIDGLDSRVHVLARAGVGSRSRDAVRERAFAIAPEEVLVDGVVVSSIIDTVVDVTRCSGFRRGVVAVDHVLHGEAVAARDPEVMRDRLTERLSRFGSARGVRKAREVIAFADARAESPLESVSRVEMAVAGLPAPRLQHVWTLPGGGRAVTDFDWPEHGLVGEADGRAKYSLGASGVTESIFREKRRENALRLLGPRVVRWEWKDAIAGAPLISLLLAAGLPRER